MPDAIAHAAALKHRWYALGLLMLVGLCNYIDRMCMSILQVPIKQELGLTDTQLGVLTGLAFSLLYTTMTVPLARLADRTSRKAVIAGAVVAWSLMTMACGLATEFRTLVVLRMGVAIGEAGCVPSSHALLSGFFPLHQRARALATWALVFPLGTLVGIASAGWLGQLIGWRGTFTMLGGIGLALGPLVLLTLREPAHGVSIDTAVPALRAALATLWRSPAFRNSAIAGALIAYPLNAELFWNGPFYGRVYGLTLGQLALWLALLSGGAGALGLWAGGFIADAWGRRDARAYLLLPAFCGFGIAPLMLLQYFVKGFANSLSFGVGAVLLLNAYIASQAAANQTMVVPNLRALAAAINVLFAGTVGAALAPFATGVLSDVIAHRYGLKADSLRYAIGFSALFGIAAGACFLRAARHFPAELARQRAHASVSAGEPAFSTSVQVPPS